MLASGVQYRRLEAPGVDRLTGAGVYCGAASTEAAAMKGERVVVVGGANSAGQAALHLSRFATEVVVAVRAGALAERMSAYLVRRLETTGNVRIVTRARVERVAGDRRLEAVRLTTSSGSELVEAAGMFASWAPSPAPSGWPATWPATTAASSSPARTSAPTCGRSSATRTCWRRACRGSSPSVRTRTVDQADRLRRR